MLYNYRTTVRRIINGHLKGVPMVGDQKTGGTIAWRQA